MNRFADACEADRCYRHEGCEGDLWQDTTKTKKALTNDIWDVEDVPEEDLQWDDEGDERPEPE